ncbi:MAG: molybdenum cofactor biosynthesis protein MoaE [Firmicutes bacterium]|jgi:molybdopterin synthase catalytic subunit|nr:molybdenum cofactor biosynthesis protein MoaE [Bacillota bacterium]
MDRYQVVTRPISVEQALSDVSDPACGGVVVFLGVVRNQFEGRASEGIEYEAYQAMAERELQRLGDDLKREFRVNHVVIEHRVGRLAVSEASVLVAVSSPHREAAFAACQAGIDRLKQTVPIWKKELWADGTEGWHDDPRPN